VFEVFQKYNKYSKPLGSHRWKLFYNESTYRPRWWDRSYLWSMKVSNTIMVSVRISS
jgi:hypothetical protein